MKSEKTATALGLVQRRGVLVYLVYFFFYFNVIFAGGQKYAKEAL